MVTKRKFGPLRYYALSFAVPAAIILVALAALGITPFGDMSLAISDGDALYINYMGYVSGVLRGEQDVLFSLTKGLGGNMAGTWGWFLGNPLFALFALFDVTDYMRVYTLVVTLCLSACGPAAYALLRELYGDGLPNVAFSSAYALNGFLVANVFQLNFFSVVPALPLALLGVLRIVRGGSPLTYVLSLTYSLASNFYFGYMAAVASVVALVALLVAERQSAAELRGVLLRYVVSSLLCAMVSSVVWLPALLSLRGGRLDQPVGDALARAENFPLPDIASKLFSGANSTGELVDGLPNVFVGVLPLFLFALFLIDGGVPVRRRAAAACACGFYLISFHSPALNLLMHGGSVTNWFNYRDSFVPCLLLIVVAAGEWGRVTAQPTGRVALAAGAVGALALVAVSGGHEHVDGTLVAADLGVLALALGAVYLRGKWPERVTADRLAACLLALASTNLGVNLYASTDGIMVWSHPEPEYRAVTAPVSALVRRAKGLDGGLWRMEVTEQRSGDAGNDPMLYGYHGVGHQGSDERDFVRRAEGLLGVRHDGMKNSYGQWVPATTDSLLGIRYVVSRDDLEAHKGYEPVAAEGDWGLYRNPHALPLALVADGSVTGTALGDHDVFDNLNRAWSAVAGTEGAPLAEERDLTFSPGDGEPPAPEGKERVVHSLSYSHVAGRDGAVYSLNGRPWDGSDEGPDTPALGFEGYYRAGEVMEGTVYIAPSPATERLLEEASGKYWIACEDAGALAGMSEAVTSRPSTVERVADGHLRGTFESAEGQVLMLTIPYDEGWTLRVDGEETGIVEVLGAFMAAEVGPGSHTFELTFVPTGLVPGAVASSLGLVAAVAYLTLDAGCYAQGCMKYPRMILPHIQSRHRHGAPQAH